MEYSKNDKVELDIIDLTISGEGLAKKDGIVFFVKNALPGDKVFANVTKVSKNTIYAKTIDIISKSVDRIDSPCDVCDACGGCQILKYDYEKQLEYKVKKVTDTLRTIGKFNVLSDKDFELKEKARNYRYDGIMKMETPYHYRNKMQIPFALKNDNIIYGFYAGRTHHIVEFNECKVGFIGAEKILNAIRDGLKKYKMSIYDEINGEGTFREVLLRTGNESKEISITYIINDKNCEKNLSLYREFDEYVMTKSDELSFTTSTLNINTSNTNVLFGNKNVILRGKGYIEDNIGSIKYNISPESFYQVNMKMTKVLYDKVVEFADFKEDERVLDLYCGIGTISLYVASFVREVLGIEVVDRAVKDAINNARINNIDNARFICRDLDASVDIMDFKPNVIIVDPPRKGLSLKTIDLIKELKPNKLIYVSCDPGTLARDLNFIYGDYYLDRVVNVDMFPHTTHIETVALIKRIGI